MQIFLRFSSVISVVALTSLGCVSSGPPISNAFGTYMPTATKGPAHFWEGDVVTLSPDGYLHSRFTDELGPWLDEPPFKQYSGEVFIEGNRVDFVESWLDPPERYIVQVDGQVFLLTPKEYRRFEVDGALPAYPLKKRQD